MAELSNVNIIEYRIVVFVGILGNLVGEMVQNGLANNVRVG